MILFALATWTLIYGVKFGGRDRFWIVNGSLLLVLSVTFLSYNVLHSILLSFAILLLCIGIIVFTTSLYSK